MKLHLPLSLRSALLAACALAAGMNSQVQAVGTENVMLKSESLYADKYAEDREGNPLYYEEGFLTTGGAVTGISISSFTLTGNQGVAIRNGDLSIMGSFVGLSGYSGKVTISNNRACVLFGVGELHSGMSKGLRASLSYLDTISISGNQQGFFYADDYINALELLNFSSYGTLEIKNNKGYSGRAAITYIGAGSARVTFNEGNSTIIRGNSNGSKLIAMDINCDLYITPATGKSFECYDAITVGGSLIINEKKNVPGMGGTVLFSGAHTKQDLGSHGISEAMMTQSRNIAVNAVSVYGGILALEDGMHMRVATDFTSMSAATLRMKSASLTANGKASISALTVYGSNTLSGNSISTSAVIFNVSSDNAQSAILDVNGALSASHFTIKIEDGLSKGAYMLMAFSDWDSSDASFSGDAQSTKVGVKGKDDIYIENGVLWFNYGFSKDIPNPEDPKVEDPKLEDPKKEDPKLEDPKKEDPKKEDPKVEDSGDDFISPDPLYWSTKGERVWAVGKGTGKKQKIDGKWVQLTDPTWYPDPSDLSELGKYDLNFRNGVSVIFDKADTVTVAGDVLPAKVTVKHELGTVAFTGTGSIGGATKLIKTGGGTLEINIANTYTGDTELKGGTTIVKNDKAFGESKVVFSDGKLDLDGHAVDNKLEIAAAKEPFVVVKLDDFLSEEDPWAISEDDTQPEEEKKEAMVPKSAIELKGATKYAGELVLTSGRVRGERINLSRTATLYSGAIENNLSGTGNVVKKGAGTVALNGTITHTGGTTVMEGTLILNSAKLTGKAFVGAGAWLAIYDSGVNELKEADTEDRTEEEIEKLVKGRVLTVQKKGTLAVHESEVHGKLVFEEESTVVADLFTLNEYDTMELHGGSVTANIELAGGTLETVAPEDTEDMEDTADEVELQQITGHLALSGGTLKLADTLTVTGNVHSTEDTTVEIDSNVLLDRREMDLIAAGNMDDVSIDHIYLGDTLENTRIEKTIKDSALHVKLGNQTLEWNSGSTGVWGLREAGGEWNTDEGVDDKHFFNLDSVVFNNAGEVKIVGNVEPAHISVTTDKGVVTGFTGEGHITGSADLEKQGEGTLKIATDNSAYSGEMFIYGGKLEVAHKNALGSGTLHIDGAELAAGGFELGNTVIFTGKGNTIGGADSARNIAFVGATVGGAYTLAKENTLSVSAGVAPKMARTVTADSGSVFTGDFVFDGGTLDLSSKLSLTGTTVFLNRSVINLDNWEGEFVVGETYELIYINNLQEADANKWFTLSRLDGVAGRGVLSFENESLWLSIKRPQADPAIAAALSRNQRAAYLAFSKVAERDTSKGELADMAEEVLAAETAEEAAALLDRLDGAELATSMASQIEGNMAHMRRLRANMGSGQQLAAGSRNAAYVVAYDDLNRVRGDASGLGIHRSEWGGMVGYERVCSENTLIGAALSSGWARVNPSGSAQRYHEDSQRVDVYVEHSFGSGWQSITSFGTGLHSFDMHRTLPNGVSSSVRNMDGWSLNFTEELSFTQKLSERSSVQPFLAVESSVNHIGSFSESGAGELSLAGRARNAWATDVTLGARYLHSFDAAAGKGLVSLQGGLVASVGDTTADLDLHFAGAPGVVYTVSSANRNRWGYNLGASVSVPLTKQTSLTAGANAVLRGDSKEAGANVGVRMVF